MRNRFPGGWQLIATLGAAMLVLGIAACGESTLDQGELEDEISGDEVLSNAAEAVTGSPVASASCPDDVKAEEGTSFECTATLEDDTEITVNGDVTSDDGDVTFELDSTELNELSLE